MMTLNLINNDISKSVYVVMVVKWTTGENGPPQRAMVR